MLNQEELSVLTDFSDRVIYLYERKWNGSKQDFCSQNFISRATFFSVCGKKRSSYSDKIIEQFARAFGVSFNFMKNGGQIAGYYKPVALSRFGYSGKA